MAWNDGLDEGTPAYNLAASTSEVVRAVAGPGSGKSFAMKRRVARLLEAGLPPEQLLAITFTRTAAQDLKREISSLGIEGVDLVHSRTLHSHALKILMQADVLERTGRRPRMVIDHEIAPALRDIETDEYGGLKEMKKLLDAFVAAWATLQTDDPGFMKEPLQKKFETDIVNWLGGHQGLLVGEVIPVVIRYLRANPASPHIGQYKAILVDEYQDLNKSEQEFIRLIKGDANIVIVGDDDQSIYSFKHAHPEGIREIETMYGKYDDIAFDECRRCPQLVTKMASSLISRNPERTLGDLKPCLSNPDGTIQIVQWRRYRDETEGIVTIIEKELATGQVIPGDILILAPRRRIGYKLRDLLLLKGISVKSYFRESAIDNEKVRRAYSLLNFLSNSTDSISLRYLLGYGHASYRKVQYEKLQEIAKKEKTDVQSVLSKILKGEITEKPFKTIANEYRTIQSDIISLRSAIMDNPLEGFAIQFVKTEIDEEDFYELNQLYRKAVEENGTEVDLSSAAEFDRWFGKVFSSLQEMIALPDSPEKINHVRIMSLHASKGLSAKLVILSSMIDQLIPYIPKDSTAEEIKFKIEEQRRLFYVAITRCKASADYPGRLIISSFTSIHKIEAMRLGLATGRGFELEVDSSRYIGELGESAPRAILGNSLI